MSDEQRPASAVPLDPPLTGALPEPTWTVLARNRRVNEGWKELSQRLPANALRCYVHLTTAPTQRYPGRVFPLRGRQYRGAWEYEIGRGERVYYLPHVAIQSVDVYYAGPHPKRTPEP